LFFMNLCQALRLRLLPDTGAYSAEYIGSGSQVITGLLPGSSGQQSNHL
jgi:hypothetical protein